jgi:hypothetical protein
VSLGLQGKIVFAIARHLLQVADGQALQDAGVGAFGVIVEESILHPLIIVLAAVSLICRLE